jgi:hypothetical protein
MTASDEDRAVRGSAASGRVFQDYESWQRSDLGPSGRYSGREYYDRRTILPEDDPADRVTSGGAARAVAVLGLIVALTGVAGWLWLILAFVSSMGGGTIADHPFDTQVAGIHLGSGGLVAIIVGSLLAVAANWFARASRSRYERSRWDPTRPF